MKEKKEKELNLYLVSQAVNNAYDTYDSFICAAETSGQARKMHPETDRHKPWHGNVGDYSSWCDEKYVEVRKIGVAEPGTKSGIILRSFNAG